MDLHTGGDIAFLRWFFGRGANRHLPFHPAERVGDLGNWEFEGNLRDSSGNGLNFTGGLVGYMASPVIRPCATRGTQQTFREGHAAVLDGSGILSSGRRDIAFAYVAVAFRTVGAELVEPQRGASTSEGLVFEATYSS